MKFSTKPIFIAIIFLFAVCISTVFSGTQLASQASNQPDPTPQPLSEIMHLIAEPSDWTVVRLYFNDREHLAQVSGMLDIWEVQKEKGYVIAAVSPEQYQWLQVSGYRLETDPEKTAQIQAPPEPLDPRYYYFNDFNTNPNGLYVVDFLNDTNTTYPELTELIDIGDAWLVGQAGEYARDIWVLRITNEDPTYGEIADKPVFFLFANIHAREVATPELAIRYIKYLTSGYNGEGGYNIDPDATWLVNHNVLYVLVMQNPDGHWVNEQNYTENRRKNMDNDDGCVDNDAFGVDLNRNSSFLWGCCGGSSADPCSETYRGPLAGSEPETQAFQNFFASVVADQNGPNGDDEIPPAAPPTTPGIFISLHSYSDLVLWPWGFDNYGDSPNFAELQTIGRKFADYNNYSPPGTIWYDVDGATDDWAYGKFGIASFTFEVGPQYGSCGGFFPAYECIDGTSGYPENFWAENKPAFIYAHKIARTPYMTAYGPDAYDISATPDEVSRGEPLQLSAIIQDQRYGSDLLAPISGAEYFIDAPGVDGTGIPLSPLDGSWGELIEEVTAILDTSDLIAGQHYILVHGKNDAGDWGPFSSVFVTVLVPDYWAVLSPESDAQQADPGQVVTYTLQVENYGVYSDTYTISTDSLWEATAPISIGPLANGESVNFDVSVTIPLTATNAESDTATVAITSQGDPSVSDSINLTTTANLYALELADVDALVASQPGESVTFMVSITNAGNAIDIYDLSASSDWLVSLPETTGPLAPGESASVEVFVFVPVNVNLGDINATTVTVTSQSDQQVTGLVVLTTSYQGLLFYLPLSFKS
jgi:carboxypeptidase T